MLKRRGGDETVHEIEFAASELVLCIEDTPSSHRHGVKWEHASRGPAVNSIKPLFDFRPTFPLIHQMNAFHHLAKCQCTDAQIGIMHCKPAKNLGRRPRLG